MEKENYLIHLLQNRQSVGLLTEPAPSATELQKIQSAALSAPDHARLKPWRYLVIKGDSRKQLGALFQAAMHKDHPELTKEQLLRYVQMPMRAPLIIVAITSLIDHPKVPESEQLLSTAVGVGYMLLATEALGYGGYWRTGPLSTHSEVKKGLGLSNNEQIVGFLYIGTAQKEPRTKTLLKVSDFFKYWP
jgi:nitroreductase